MVLTVVLTSCWMNVRVCATAVVVYTIVVAGSVALSWIE